MIFKLAIKNIVRSPGRTLLYFLIIFMTALSVSCGCFVKLAGDNASSSLASDYMFVATLTSATTGEYDKGAGLSDFIICAKSDTVKAYNVSLTLDIGELAEPEALTSLPVKIENPDDVPAVTSRKIGCDVLASNNIALEPLFFDGTYYFVAGGDFTKEGYAGDRAEMIIPRWVSEKYSINVGDTVVKYMQGVNIIYRAHTVVGVYDTADSDSASLPSYEPIELYCQEYARLTLGKTDYIDGIGINRADFVLGSSGDFEKFVLDAKENGLSFTSCKLTFNDKAYNILKGQLDNVNMIILLMIAVISLTCAGVITFFTAYFYNSRKNEFAVLRCLGMPQRKVRLLFFTEIIILFVISASLGAFTGYKSSGAVCDYINTSVMTEANEMANIKQSELTRDSARKARLPLEQIVGIRISLEKAPEAEDKITNRLLKSDGKISVRYQNIYNSNVEGTSGQPDEVWKTEDKWEKLRLCSVSDITSVNTSVSYEEAYEERGFPGRVFCYVSESSGHKAGDIIRVQKTLYSELYMYSGVGGVFAGRPIISFSTLCVAGTYEENEYFSGNDIIVRAEDFDGIYYKFSLYDGQALVFGRNDIIY